MVFCARILASDHAHFEEHTCSTRLFYASGRLEVLFLIGWFWGLGWGFLGGVVFLGCCGLFFFKEYNLFLKLICKKAFLMDVN